MSEAKMMIVMRRDLKMRKGKIAAQAGHACVEASLRTLMRDGLLSQMRLDENGQMILPENDGDLPIAGWINRGEAKICVYVDSEQELLDIHQKAMDKGFISALICDAGRTEFNGEATLTCLAIEPLPAEVIDSLTGTLPLY